MQQKITLVVINSIKVIFAVINGKIQSNNLYGMQKYITTRVLNKFL